MADLIFGERLKLLRTESKLTQQQMADILSLGGKQIIWNYENGLSEPSIEVIKGTASYFNVSTDYLLGQSDIQNDMMPVLSKEITAAWMYCKENIKLASILQNMLVILKTIKSSYDVYGFPVTKNEFTNWSEVLFSNLNDLYELIIHNSIKGTIALPSRDHSKKCNELMKYIDIALNELRWAPFELDEDL